jgi:hypothetical protein
MNSISRLSLLIGAIGGSASLALPKPAQAQMVTGKDMPGFAAAFGLDGNRRTTYEAKETAISVGNSVGANVLWPGETARITFRFTNKTAQPLRAEGRLEVVRYGTSVETGDVWVPHVFKIADAGSVPLSLNLPANGSEEATVAPPIPATFGGYALIADLGTAGRAFSATLVRTPKPEPGRVQFPTYALDLPWPFEMSEAVATLFERLGVKGCRMGAGYRPTTDPGFQDSLKEFDQQAGWAQKHNVTVMLTVGEGGAPMPLGRPRPWLTPDGVMQETKSDYAWLPEYDADFQKWSRYVAGRYGWPKGPVNAMELWNEPWEGISISGWGADMLRYRDLYARMAQGIVAARRDDGVRVLIGGACSSTNTRDKLFPDGSDKYLKWLDFVSIHYQPLAADPALDKAWIHRKSSYGPVRVWDTESWIANSEDRVAGVIASMRAQGQSRTAGIYGGNVYTPEILSDQPRVGIAQAWAPAAAVAASQKFIGQRAFREILFKNGLPWVFVFDGLPVKDGSVRTRPDDGTLVVLGDLGGVYERNRTKFRSVLGLKNAPKVAALEASLAKLPPNARDADRQALQNRLAAAQVLEGGRLTLSNPAGEFVLFDFYGNPLPSKGGEIVVPLNGKGYFLRANGARGSFARLVQAVRSARIDGYEPAEIVAKDLTAPISRKPALRLDVTNILNRPIACDLTVKLGALKLDRSRRKLALRPHETKEVTLRVVGGRSQPSNAYRLIATLDAGKDGKTSHEETLHVDWIARRSVRADGDLSDWKGILPQTASAGAEMGASLTEKAYLPFMKFDAKTSGGLATGYVAYDSRYFYFAAKIADSTPYRGNVRFATRDDDRYFYPKVSYEMKDGRRIEHVWPEGVRRFSYRKDPDLPSGNGTDGVQIAFNVLPESQKPWLPYPPGTMPRFMTYWDTDYEFAFNPVAPEYGGGAEIWRLQAPGIPRKHFYPRQPKAPKDGGPVRNGRLAMKRIGNARIVEAALPWSEIPEVRKRLEAGGTVKFDFRVNDDQGPAYELAMDRSVSREGNPSFHNDWASHWANELEFGFEK